MKSTLLQRAIGMAPVLFYLISCNSDDVTLPPEGGVVFHFEVGDNYAGSHYTNVLNDEQWIVISDQHGVSSEAYRVVNNTSIEIEVPGDYSADEKFTLNLVYHYDTKSAGARYNMISYAEVEPGDYKLLALPQRASNSGTGYPHTFTINNTPDITPEYYGGVYGATIGGWSFQGGAGELVFNTSFMDSAPGMTYYASFSPDDCRYIHINDARLNDPIEIDFADMTPFEHSVTYHFDKPVNAMCFAQGIKKEDFVNRQDLVSARTGTQAHNSLTYHFSSEDKFDRYHTVVEIRGDGDAYAQEAMYYYGDHIATEYVRWGGEILHAGFTNGQLKTELSKSASMISATSQHKQGTGVDQIIFTHTVYTPGDANRSTTFPLLPKSLTGQHPYLTSPSWEFHRAAVYDFSGSNVYKDVIAQQFQPEGTTGSTLLGIFYGQPTAVRYLYP